MKAPPSAYVTMLITGALAAAALGGVAAWFSDENRLMAFVIFAVCTAGPTFVLSWFVFVMADAAIRYAVLNRRGA
ncbi:hypothetical protein D9R06_08865 [Kocuria marina subsp. indica]|nr:hypothetical protein B1B07_08390 [Kocuria indica]RLP57536.1 hypothetical protein D9R06_08865 [Kocuria indica]